MDFYKKGFLLQNRSFIKVNFSLLTLCWLLLFVPSSAICVAELPGSADAGKFRPDSKRGIKPEEQQSSKKLPEIIKKESKKPVTTEEANDFRFFLSEVNVKGVDGLDPRLIKKIYSPYLNRTISLKEAYQIVDKITDLYNEKGYFLSVAYLPDQKINEKLGVLQIVVIEGYIHNIQLPTETKKYNKQIFTYLKGLLKQKPINIKFLENCMMRINDLFEYKFKGTLINLNDTNNGAVKLVLNATKKSNTGKLSFDNFASKAVGPHQFKFLYTQPLSPFNQTKLLCGGNPLLIKKFNYINLSHTFLFSKNINLDFSGGFTRMKPGESFRNVDVKSDSNNLNTSINYKLLYQRDSSVDVKFTFGIQNANNNILNNSFSKDRIRTIKFNTSYTFTGTKDYGFVDFIFTKGLSVLRASKKEDPNLSRSGAVPNFNKLELNAFYSNRLYDSFYLLLGFYGQYTNQIMFSSEEFGYGGQSFGKAYDSSYISGDRGVSASIELSYSRWANSKYWVPVPYIYSDFGVIWRKDPTRIPKETGISCGFGVRNTVFRLVNINFGLAWPINKKIDKPIYGQKPRAPRILLEVNFNKL